MATIQGQACTSNFGREKEVYCKSQTLCKISFWILNFEHRNHLRAGVFILHCTNNFGRAKEREITKVGFKAKLWVDAEAERAIFSQLKFKHWKEKDKRKKQRKRKRTKKKEERKKWWSNQRCSQNFIFSQLRLKHWKLVHTFPSRKAA